MFQRSFLKCSQKSPNNNKSSFLQQHWWTTTTYSSCPYRGAQPIPTILKPPKIPSFAQPSRSRRRQAFIRFSSARSCDPFDSRKYSTDSSGVSRASITFIDKSRRRPFFLSLVSHSEPAKIPSKFHAKSKLTSPGFYPFLFCSFLWPLCFSKVLDRLRRCFSSQQYFYWKESTATPLLVVCCSFRVVLTH